MHSSLIISVLLIFVLTLMFSKLVTPEREPRKATLRDFLRVDITPEKDSSAAVKRFSFDPHPQNNEIPPKNDNSANLIQDLNITPEKKPCPVGVSKPTYPEPNIANNHREHSLAGGSKSCEHDISGDLHPPSTENASGCSCCFSGQHVPGLDEQQPKKHGPTATSDLKKRYQDRQYVVNLIYTETSHGRRGKDCTCANKSCKLLFQKQIGSVERIQKDLLANWGPLSTRKDRKDNLYTDLLVGQQHNPTTGKLEQHWLVDGHAVCYNFYLKARGYTHEYVRRRRVLLKQEDVTHGSIDAYIESTKSGTSPHKKEQFVSWLTDYATTVGDYMPNEVAVVLPYSKFEGVWMEYKFEMQRRDESWCCYSYACRIFNEEIANIRLVRTKGTFVSCKVCTSYQMRILKSRSSLEREQLKLLRLEHVNKQRQERLHYYSHREAALQSPDKVMSIIIDGMDQSKTNIPLFSRRTSTRVISQRLIGVKVHGHGNWVYLVDENVKGGANLMVEVLRLTLLDLETLGKLPHVNPTLYLQLDNCSENKNKVLFGFISHLVSKGVFAEAYIGFLMVGHTHEDIDQFFSIISAHLRKLETICPDFQSLETEIANSFLQSKKNKSQLPNIRRLCAVEIFDYDRYYLPHINAMLAHHSIPHQFRFQKIGTVVLCHYKMWSVDVEWLPLAVSPENGTDQLSPSLGVDEETSAQSKNVKKRKFTRGAAKPHLKKKKIVATQAVSHSSDDEPKEPPHDFYLPEFASLQLPIQGILWLTSLPDADACPKRVFVSDDDKEKKKNSALSMFDYIVNTCSPANPQIFNQLSIENWTQWKETQIRMWDQTCDFLLTLPHFKWISPFRQRAKLLEDTIPAVLRSEKCEPLPGIQIITHDSHEYGTFSNTNRTETLRQRNLENESVLNAEIISGKAVIYRWHDEEDGNYYIWLAIVCSVIGDPSSRNCQLRVKWCPPAKQYQFRARINAEDTFDTKYTRTTGRTSQFVVTIDKQDCLAVNLQLTQSGKLDSKHRAGDHLGSTSKEVAADAIENFYSNPTAGIQQPSL